MVAISPFPTGSATASDTARHSSAGPGSRAILNNSASVTVDALEKNYGSYRAIRGVDFRIEAGSTVSLLGPSGCGKTTTLRCIAGLEKPSAGRIMIGDEIVYDGATGYSMPPERRKLGMVFQSYAIWPHMTVARNVEFPLRIAGKPKSEIRDRSAAVLEMVGLAHLSDRSASALSGGQQQRVALARALVNDPRIVLFDEPLSNLDANLRERMRSELQQLQDRMRFTAIYVTHDQAEAMALSNRVVILNQGRVEQEGEPAMVFQHPRTPFAAQFLGYSNKARGRVAGSGGQDGFVNVDLESGLRMKARWCASLAPAEGMEAVILFRAERVQLEKGPAVQRENLFPADVRSAAFLGTHIDYNLGFGGLQVQAHGVIDHAVAAGSEVFVRISPEHCHAFPSETAQSPMA